MRLYDPTEGTIAVDGRDLKEVRQDAWREQLGIVFQENLLFNTTMRENIRLGKLGATDEEVEAAARAAEIHAFIRSLPEGYDSKVGERGGQLSGGERQRIAIARAIIRNPAILLLDEATSALDAATAAALDATLEQIAKGRTVISVTHRLASVARADYLVVLNNGRVVEQGRHEELLTRNGLYAGLWEKQTLLTAREQRTDVGL